MTKPPIRLTDLQARAIRPDATVWVRASAGTGKTQVLSARVLRLLLDGTRPERLLCLTYTKAAAAEMAHRIFQELSIWSTCPEGALCDRLLPILGRAPDPDQIGTARVLFARTLDAPGGLRIQTIHAFCQSLLARFPLEAGLLPGFRTLEPAADALLQSTALDQLVARAVSLPDRALLADFQHLAIRHGDQALPGLLAEVRKPLHRHARQDLLRRDSLEPRLRAALGLPLSGDFADWFHAEIARGEPDEAALRDIHAGWRQGQKQMNDRAAHLAEWLEKPAQRLELLDALERAFLTTKGVEKKSADVDARRAAPYLDELVPRVAKRVRRLTDQRRLFTVMASSAAAGRIGLELNRDIEQTKHARGLVAFDDLIRATADLLETGAAGWVHYKLDAAIEQILLDEAQDTNPEQWRILDALSAEFYAGEGARTPQRTMFAVGDLKQSIYRFQGAVPHLFPDREADYRARAGRVDQGFETVPLDTSYRSTQTVLSAVDAVLADLGPDALGLDQPAGQHVAARAAVAGVVTLWPLVVDDGDDANAAPDARALTVEALRQELTQPWRPKAQRLLARRIARQIRRWLDQGMRLPGRGRRVEPGDIMVLVSTREGVMGPLVDDLKALGVPVAGVDRVLLAEQIAAQDVVACLRFVLQPDDDLTLAVLLRSPLLGWSEAALEALAAGRPRQQTLWAALTGAAEAGDPAARAAHDWLGAILARADQVAPFELIQTILHPLGGRERLFARLGAEADEALVLLADEALAYERDGTPSLQGFLDRLDRSAPEIKRDPEAARNEVRVMTVHGAKGLQAPIVILADAHRLRPDRPAVLTLTDSDDAPWPLVVGSRSLAVGPIAASAEAEARESEREYWRLLYVALTRAEDMLFVAGHVPGNTGPPDPDKPPERESWHMVVERALIALGAQTETSRIWRTKITYRSGTVAPGLAEPARASAPEQAPALPDWAVGAPADEPVPPRPLAPSRLPEPPASVDVALAPERAQARLRGVLMHRLFERLPGVSSADRPAVAARLARHHGAGLPEAVRAQAVVAVLEVMARPELADLFSAAGLAEVAVSALLGESAINGQIDRLIVRPDDVLAVDFKTALAVPATPAETPVAYLRQMRAYRDALARIWPDRTVAVALLWTSAPLLMPLPDYLLDAIEPFPPSLG